MMKERNFFKWLFKKKSYYIISILLTLFNSLEELTSSQFPAFLGSVIANFIFVGILFFIGFVIMLYDK